MFEQEKDGVVPQSKVKPPAFRDHVIIAVSEFIGTTILVFLSCLGSCLTMQEFQGKSISSMHTSFNAGLAVTVVIQIFGHLSAAHVNPAVSLNALIVNQIGWRHLPSYVLPQILGSLTGSALFVGVTNSESLDYPEGGSGVCVNAISNNITVWQGFAVEFLLSLILNFAVSASWDLRNSDKLDSVSLRIGLLVVAVNLAAGVYTGASMNPARSFGPAVFAGDYKNHWVYWVGPVAGGVVAASFYRMVFMKN